MPLTLPPNPWQKQELELSSPSLTPPLGRPQVEEMEMELGQLRRKAPCRYSQETPWLPVQRAASSRVSSAKEKTFMSNPGLGQRSGRQLSLTRSHPRATCFSCRHLVMIYPPSQAFRDISGLSLGKEPPRDADKGQPVNGNSFSWPLWPLWYPRAAGKCGEQPAALRRW